MKAMSMSAASASLLPPRLVYTAQRSSLIYAGVASASGLLPTFADLPSPSYVEPASAPA